MAVDTRTAGRRHDQYGRQISYLRLSVTDRCNLRCRYCVPAGGVEWMARDHHLTDDEIIRIVRVAAQRGLSKIRITGGEPLVRPGIVELIAELARIPGIRDLPMTTNGLLLARYAEPLKQAGLHRVNVSVDTFDRAKFALITGRDGLDMVWKGIEAAARAGLAPIKLNMVVQRGLNDDECVAMARLTQDHPYHVRFIELMPVADFDEWHARHLPNSEVMAMISRSLGPLRPVEREEPDGPAQSYQLDGAAGRLGFISAISDDHFCDRCNRFRLTAGGMLRPCLFSSREVDLRSVLRSGGSDDELHARFDHALAVKPAAHELTPDSRERMLVTMINIGG
jgi:cyclic pyranopterin phosphate synthase